MVAWKVALLGPMLVENLVVYLVAQWAVNLVAKKVEQRAV